MCRLSSGVVIWWTGIDNPHQRLLHDKCANRSQQINAKLNNRGPGGAPKEPPVVVAPLHPNEPHQPSRFNGKHFRRGALGLALLGTVGGLTGGLVHLDRQKDKK